MSENPLLPHRKLRELYLLMLRCRDLERRRAKSGAHPTKSGAHLSDTRAREAYLAATTMQLLPGDLFSADFGDTTAETLAPVGKTGKGTGLLHTSLKTRLAACAGAALGMKASATDGLVLALTRAGAPETDWQEALTWAHNEQLPLVVLCEDAINGGNSKNRDVLNWAAIDTFTRKLKFAVIAVDGEDAVAVYRVMQESVIRARTGCGPAVIWAVTTPGIKAGAKPRSRSQQPVARMQNYLRVRKIALPKRP